MLCYVGVEGYTLKQGFVLKELALLYETTEYSHHIFAPPPTTLSLVDSKTVRYVTRYLNGLSYSEGQVPYSSVIPILKAIQHMTVYTYGANAVSFLLECLPNTVIIDVQEFNYEMPTILPPSNCPRFHNSRYCALAKGQAIKNFIESGI